MRQIFFALLFFALPGAANAYLPPAFYVYSKLAEPKNKNTVTGVTLTVARPQASGTEEILGSVNVFEWKPTAGSWPTLSIIFESNFDRLLQAINAFGLNVATESELLKFDREKLRAMKDAPASFYRPDPTMSLRRTRQTYAWVHSSQETARSVWVEKDSFLPLKIAAACPQAATNLGWAKAGENKCELEFRNLSALRRGSFQNARMTLWKDGAPLLFFTFDRILYGKGKLPPPDGKLPAEVREIAETILH